MSIKAFIIGVFLFFSYYIPLFSQCFASPGNPVGGTESIGVMKKGMLRFATHYKYLQSDVHYERNNRIESTALPFYAGTYNYTGYMLGYGISDRLTTEISGGYFFNKTYHYHSGNEQEGSGFSNLSLLAKYAVYQNLPARFEIDMSAGAIIPLRQGAQVKNNMEVPIDLQSSTGNYGFAAEFQAVKEYAYQGIRLFYTTRYETYLPNSKSYSLSETVYEFGDFFTQSFYFSKHFKFFSREQAHHITLIGQLRHEHKWQNKRNDEIIRASGNTLLYFSPQLTYSLRQRYNLTAIFDIPVYRYYNGKQLAASYAFSVAFSTYLFGGE
jgi:hypothetical protein